MKRLSILMAVTVMMVGAPALMALAQTPPPQPPPPVEEPATTDQAEQPPEISPGPPPGPPCFTAEQIEDAEPALRPTMPPCPEEAAPPAEEEDEETSTPPSDAMTLPSETVTRPSDESTAPPAGDQQDWRPVQTLSPSAPAGATFGLRRAQDYIAIRQRPLFAPDRTPPRALPEIEEVVVIPDEQPAVEEAIPELAPLVEAAPDWLLVGLVRSPSLNSAMFRKVGEADGFSLRRGESRDGWKLSEVGRFDVVLENENGSARLGFPSE